MTEKDRARKFAVVCERLGIEGVTLHCYRYAWAERAAEAGVPERQAMAALGHNNKAVHRAYAKKAKVVCPPLENYQGANVVPVNFTPEAKAASV